MWISDCGLRILLVLVLDMEGWELMEITNDDDYGFRCQVSGRKSKRAETRTLKPRTLRFGVWNFGFEN